MLNPTLVLNYIKQNVSFPFQVLEMKDDEILDYINDYILPRFSNYVPDKNKIGVDLSKDEHKTDIENEFLIFDPDGRQIINIVEAIPNFTSNIISGHPFLGVSSFEELPAFALNVEKSRNASKWGFANLLVHFIPPNKIRTNPTYKGYMTIIYERVHSPTYATIPIWAERYFLDYCLGHIMLLLGNKRKKFSTIQTPYGEVPLNADEVKSDGKELIEKIEEQLQMYNPNIIVDIG